MQKANLEFRKIPSLYFLYEVNEDGTVVRNVKSKKHLRIFLGEWGYYQVQFNIKKHVKKRTVHSLVAECWLGPRPEGLEIDHIDRNRFNNHYSNLRYADRSMQMKNRNYERFIETMYVNLDREPVAVKLGEQDFPSMREAARWLSERYGKPWKHYLDQLARSYNQVGGYTVTYSDGRQTMTPKYPAKPLSLQSGDEVLFFDSKKAAGEFLSQHYNLPYTTVAWKLTRNRKHVYDYDVTYGM